MSDYDEEAEKKPLANGWQPMDTAPRDETHVLLFTTDHGQVEAWFACGEWHDYLEGREYDGPSWVCADDAFQIEIEELPGGLFYDGTATAWRPLHLPPMMNGG